MLSLLSWLSFNYFFLFSACSEKKKNPTLVKIQYNLIIHHADVLSSVFKKIKMSDGEGGGELIDN